MAWCQQAFAGLISCMPRFAESGLAQAIARHAIMRASCCGVEQSGSSSGS